MAPVCFGSDVAEQAQAARDVAADKGDARERAFSDLQREVIKALEAGNLASLINAPGWGGMRQRATLDDVLGNEIADAQTWRSLIELVAVALKSSDAAVRYMAMAWAARVANAHAEFHADDAVRMEEESERSPLAPRMWRAK